MKEFNFARNKRKNAKNHNDKKKIIQEQRKQNKKEENNKGNVNFEKEKVLVKLLAYSVIIKGTSDSGGIPARERTRFRSLKNKQDFLPFRADLPSLHHF